VDLRPINKEQPFNKINALLDQLSKKWDQREGKPHSPFKCDSF
jgi:hypothetical protein